MNVFGRSVVLLGLSLVFAVPVPAQTIKDADDGTTLKQIIIYGRHSVRSSTKTPAQLANYAVDAYPDFAVPAGYLTARGRQAEVLLGSYFHDYLVHEGLLTDNAQEDSARSYFRAQPIERTNVTAAAFQEGVIPSVTAPLVHSFPLSQYPTDPVFDPIYGKVVTVDTERAVAEVRGVFNSGDALRTAYGGEYSLIRSVLFGYPLGTQPPPPAPGDKTDVAALPVTLTASTALFTGNVIALGGLNDAVAACDPFVMQYADNFPLEKVGWGRFVLGEDSGRLDTLSQQARLVTLQFSLEMRTPYLNQLQSSNLASHVLRTMKQAVSGKNMRGAFGNAKTRLNVIISSDIYVFGLAGLLDLHWQLPNYQPDFCSPGGALVFELRQEKKSKAHFVRVFYTAQTFDQLRDLKPLTLVNPPATMQLLVPGGSKSSTNLDVPFSAFQKLMKKAIEPKYAQRNSKEVQPGVLVVDPPR